MTGMLCPECKSLNEAGSAACTNCGLLLINAAPPKRRAEDQAVQKRRARDREMISCKFCSGAIASDAIRCRHCSEIVNEEFYRERSQRLRSRINYASWVAYLLGLGALVVFRPVGLLSIAAGLILSIIYYAIPTEPPASPSDTARTKKQRGGFFTFLKRQLKFERVGVSLPVMRHKKLFFVGTPLVAALVGYSANLLLLQEPMNDVLKENSAFNGMSVSAHYRYWVVPGVVVYDLQSVGFRQTPIDVHTAFVEFARKLREKRYSRVELSYKGTTKFSIDGASFQKLGKEYAAKNYDYVLYTFPRLLHAEDGAHKAPSNASDRDALMQFHREWYGEDALTRSISSGL